MQKTPGNEREAERPDERRAGAAPIPAPSGAEAVAIDRALDAALESTFPASDPVASFVFR